MKYRIYFSTDARAASKRSRFLLVILFTLPGSASIFCLALSGHTVTLLVATPTGFFVFLAPSPTNQGRKRSWLLGGYWCVHSRELAFTLLGKARQYGRRITNSFIAVQHSIRSRFPRWLGAVGGKSLAMQVSRYHSSNNSSGPCAAKLSSGLPPLFYVRCDSRVHKRYKSIKKMEIALAASVFPSVRLVREIKHRSISCKPHTIPKVSGSGSLSLLVADSQRLHAASAMVAEELPGDHPPKSSLHPICLWRIPHGTSSFTGSLACRKLSRDYLRKELCFYYFYPAPMLGLVSFLRHLKRSACRFHTEYSKELFLASFCLTATAAKTCHEIHCQIGRRCRGQVPKVLLARL